MSQFTSRGTRRDEADEISSTDRTRQNRTLRFSADERDDIRGWFDGERRADVVYPRGHLLHSYSFRGPVRRSRLFEKEATERREESARRIQRKATESTTNVR